MIIFHEGLPRSGKSYEAMVERIIPALAKGRAVVAYVEGLDFDRIAELAKITPDRCRELLKALTRQDMENWLEHTRDNALHVFDEAQNFWGNRDKLSKAETQFITEHGHRGIDVVLMGQDLRDVNAIWRRRVELKLCFLKLNGVGLAGRYSCTTYRHLGGDEYSRVGASQRAYDKRYFGTYKSFVSQDTNTEVFSDDRAQVANHPAIKYGVPLALVLAVWGGIKLWGFFHQAAPVADAPKTYQGGQLVQQAVPAAPVPPAPVPAANGGRSPLELRLEGLSKQYRIRLAGLVLMGDRVGGLIEWVDSGTRVMERLSLDTLRQMGAGVVASDGFVRLEVGDWHEVATMWPMEADGRVSAARLDTIKPAAEPSATAVISLAGLVEKHGREVTPP